MKAIFKIATAAALVATAATASADTVILKSGMRYDVPKAVVKDGQVHFELYGQPVAYDMSMIREVIHGPMPEKTKIERKRRPAPKTEGRRITVPRDQAPSARAATRPKAKPKSKWRVADDDVILVNGFTGTVYPVHDYLEENLNDPDSIDYVRWSKVETDGERYRVFVKYRAKNVFGGYVLKHQGFLMDKNGRVILTRDVK